MLSGEGRNRLQGKRRGSERVEDQRRSYSRVSGNMAWLKRFG